MSQPNHFPELDLEQCYCIADLWASRYSPTIEQVILHRTILKAQPYLIEFVIRNDNTESYQHFLSFAPLGFVTGYEARELLEAHKDIDHVSAESAYLNFGKSNDPIMKKLNKFVFYKRGLKKSDVTPWDTTTKEAIRIIQTDFNWILWPKPTELYQHDSVDNNYSESPPIKNATSEPEIRDRLIVERSGEMLKFEYQGKKSLLKKKARLEYFVYVLKNAGSIVNYLDIEKHFNKGEINVDDAMDYLDIMPSERINYENLTSSSMDDDKGYYEGPKTHSKREKIVKMFERTKKAVEHSPNVVEDSSGPHTEVRPFNLEGLEKEFRKQMKDNFNVLITSKLTDGKVTYKDLGNATKAERKLNERIYQSLKRVIDKDVIKLEQTIKDYINTNFTLKINWAQFSGEVEVK